VSRCIGEQVSNTAQAIPRRQAGKKFFGTYGKNFSYHPRKKLRHARHRKLFFLLSQGLLRYFMDYGELT
jgi:hypothetical protein